MVKPPVPTGQPGEGLVSQALPISAVREESLACVFNLR